MMRKILLTSAILASLPIASAHATDWWLLTRSNELNVTLPLDTCVNAKDRPFPFTSPLVAMQGLRRDPAASNAHFEDHNDMVIVAWEQGLIHKKIGVYFFRTEQECRKMATENKRVDAEEEQYR